MKLKIPGTIFPPWRHVFEHWGENWGGGEGRATVREGIVATPIGELGLKEDS